MNRTLADASRILLGPAAAAIAHSTRVVISPDDGLQYVAFAALNMPGRNAPLGIEKEVAFVPSASVWAEMRRQMGDREPAPRAVAIFADPIYDAGDQRARATAQASAAYLPRLIHTGEEAEYIRSASAKHDVWIATGADASLDALRSADLTPFRFVQFSAHTSIDDAQPERSGIMLSLVRADGSPRAGFVGASELGKLHLRADAVVLDGCETAIGPVVRGEGMVSLLRPLFQAGARSVVATLWPIEDAASAAFMKEFYASALHGASPAAALRAAADWMSRTQRWRDPAFWSGYVLVGDSR